MRSDREKRRCSRLSGSPICLKSSFVGNLLLLCDVVGCGCSSCCCCRQLRPSCRRSPDARHSSATQSIRHNHPGIVAIIVPTAEDHDDSSFLLTSGTCVGRIYLETPVDPRHRSPSRVVSWVAWPSSLISRFVGTGSLNRRGTVFRPVPGHETTKARTIADGNQPLSRRWLRRPSASAAAVTVAARNQKRADVIQLRRRATLVACLSETVMWRTTGFS